MTNKIPPSIFKFTPQPPRIIICDNGRNGKLKDMYKDNKYITIVNRREKHKNASVEHAIGLNRAFTEVKTNRTAMIESDCSLLDC